MQEVTTKRMHSVKLDAGKHMSLTGINEVVSFNENAVLLKSDNGGIEIKGSGLNVQKFDIEDGTVNIDGEVNSFRYMNAPEKQQGFFKRLFK